jgi:hypothetical protein
METKDNSKDRGNKLLSHYWNLNSKEYQDQISFIWKHNEIRIDIRSYCEPPGRDKCVHFNFYINGEHTLFKYLYNCYGAGVRGKTPELLSENYRLTFHASPHGLEIYEEKINQDDNQDKPLDIIQNQRKDLWISVYKHYRSGMRYDTPFKDSKIVLWIKKSFNYQYSSDVLLFKYDLYSTELFHLTPTIGNFVCQKIFDYCKPIGCGVYSYIKCQITDSKGEYRNYYWLRNGLEDLTIFEIIGFFQSLRCYNDWKDYDQFQELYKSQGVSDTEIDNLLKKVMSDLGISRELY